MLRNPLGGLEEICRRSEGGVARLNLGLFRPYLVTRPEHVQHVLRDNASNYVRESVAWRPLRRLIGNGISGEGPRWSASRKLLQPLFSGRNVASLAVFIAEAIAEVGDELDHYARTSQSFDVQVEMTRFIHRAMVRAFFGDRISPGDADELGRLVDHAFSSLGARMVLPFLPDWVPMPGDRSVRRAVQAADEVMLPLIREGHRPGSRGGDIVSLLLQARDEQGLGLDEQQIRDDVVAMFVAATDTSVQALTWLWITLDKHPAVQEKLRAEVDRVVGDARPGPEHLARLDYTKLVLQEILRLYPLGWLIPRMAKADDTIGGVLIKRGASLYVSPYLTQRMEELWDNPDQFEPERFAADRAGRRHRFAYYPFGSGAHQCLGNQLFNIEGQLVVATILSRYRSVLQGASGVRPRPIVTLRPDRRVQMTLSPVGQSRARAVGSHSS